MKQSFQDFFYEICDIKEFIVKFNYIELSIFKNYFYGSQYPKWKLDLIWEYIFDDIDYNSIVDIFLKSRAIKEVKQMKLTGKVLKPFNDGQDNFKEYTPADEYKDADTFTAEQGRYTELFNKGFVEKGKPVKNYKIEDKKEEE